MKEETENNKKINEIEIDSLIKEVYNKVAEWHNEDASQAGLKHISIDIIKMVTDENLKHFGIETETEVMLDEKTKKEAIKEKYGKD